MLLETDVIKITAKGHQRTDEVRYTDRPLRHPEVDILMYLYPGGEATVEELGMNLKLMAKDLIPAVDRLKSLELVYVVPFRMPANIVTEQNLAKSMVEEANASADYAKRAKIADSKTAKLYAHIAKEEDGHYKELGSQLNKIERS